MTAKHIKERRIWDEFSHAMKFTNVGESSDKPDVIINEGNQQRGFEITSIYQNGTAARVKNHPGYLKSLRRPQSEREYKHKEDKRRIGIFQDPNNKSDSKQYYSLSLLPTVEEHSSSLLKAIANKNELFPQYQKLDEISLIIKDTMETYRITDQDSDFISYALTPEVRQAVGTSDFEEIFLITEFKSGTVIIPLKLNQEVSVHEPLKGKTITKPDGR